MKGWVYVLHNSFMPGIVKIGYSLKDPTLRAQELGSTGVPGPYEVLYATLVDDPRTLEQRVHADLKMYNAGKEWFSCSPEIAVISIREMVQGNIYYQDSQSIDAEKTLQEHKNRRLKEIEIFLHKLRMENMILDLDTDRLQIKAQEGNAEAHFALGIMPIERWMAGNRSMGMWGLSLHVVGDTIHCLKQAAKQGHGNALKMLQYLDMRTKSEIEKMRLLEIRANAGCIESKFQFALMYEKEKTLFDNYEIAEHLYKQAAEKGHIQAQVRLAQLHDEVVGVFVGTQDIAVFWYNQAAKNGDSLAQYRLGAIYEKGEGVAIDKGIAFEWYKQSAEQGYANAQFLLAEYYENSKDNQIALKWYRRAAEQGHEEAFMCLEAMAEDYADAQYALGKMYLEGLGVTQDNDMAVEWLEMAAEEGSIEAKSILKEIYKHF